MKLKEISEAILMSINIQPERMQDEMSFIEKPEGKNDFGNFLLTFY
jgi:hypothetical protein